MAKVISTLVSDLVKSIRSLEMIELDILIKVLRSKIIELRSFVLALQIHIPTAPILFSDVLMFQELPFHIWGIVINLTKEFSKDHDLVIDDLAQVVMDLDELAKQTIVSRPIKISERRTKSVPEIVDAVFANPILEIKYEEVSKISNDSSNISTHTAPLSEQFIHATTIIPTCSASKEVHIATSCVRPGCFNGHPFADMNDTNFHYISCLTLLNGYCKEGKMIDAYKILVEMIERGYKPDGFLIHPNDLEVPNTSLMANNVKFSECAFVLNKSLEYKDAKTSYVATEIQNMAVMKKLHLLIINCGEFMEIFEILCAVPAIHPTWPNEQEFADAQAIFDEMNILKCERKTFIFDPGGTSNMESILDLEDKLFDLMIECALLRYELNEYKMFDLMLEQNGRKTCDRKVFIFDPGGNLTIAAKLFDEIFKGIFDGKYHNHLYMTLDTFKRVELTKRSAGQVVYQILLQAALIQPVLHISMLKLCPNLHEATSLPSASTISIASSKLELNYPSYLMLLERSPSIFTAPAEVSFSATSNATSLSHLVPFTPMELAPAKESSSMIECVPLQIIPLSHSHFISGSCLTGNILCLERKVLIFDPGGNFKLGCSFAVRMIQGDAKLTHNSNSITCYRCHQRPTLRTRSFSRGR